MQYITTAERIGMEKGMEIGMEKGMEIGMEKGMKKGMEIGAERGFLLGSLQTVLEMKFGDRGVVLYPKIRRIQKKDRLEKILQTAESANSPEEILNAVKGKKKKTSAAN